MTPDELKKLQMYDRVLRGMGNVGVKMLAVGNPWMGIPRGPHAPGLADDALKRMELEQLNRQRSAQSALFGGTDPRTGITWNQGRPAQQQQIATDPNTPPEARRASLMGLQQTPSLLAQAAPQKTIEALIAQQFPKATAAKDPLIRDFKVGDEFVTKRYNRDTGDWEEVSRGPRYKPETNITNLIGDPKEYRKSQAKFARVDDSLERYASILKASGARLLPGAAKAELKAAYTDTLLELKTLAELGAITGPDYQLMQDLMTDPTTMKGNWLDLVGGTEAFERQIDLVREKITAGRALADQLYGPDWKKAAPVGTTEPSPKRYKYNPNTGELDPQ